MTRGRASGLRLTPRRTLQPQTQVPTPWPNQMMLRNAAAFISRFSQAGVHGVGGTLASSLGVGSWEQASMADVVLSCLPLSRPCGVATIPPGPESVTLKERLSGMRLQTDR